MKVTRFERRTFRPSCNRFIYIAALCRLQMYRCTFELIRDGLVLSIRDNCYSIEILAPFNLHLPSNSCGCMVFYAVENVLRNFDRETSVRVLS